MNKLFYFAELTFSYKCSPIRLWKILDKLPYRLDACRLSQKRKLIEMLLSYLGMLSASDCN
jgi:hypothetical protein